MSALTPDGAPQAHGAPPASAADRSAAPVAAPDARRLSRPEFVAMIAMLFATMAFSIDAMLPALPEIAASLTPEAPNRAQLIVTAFVLGMGLGTFVTGPVSDALGRKPVILGGAALYVAGALLAWRASSLEALLIGRLIQGLGAAGPRVVALAIVRDLYQGRGMAKIMSFVMTVFTLAPAIAPLIGSVIIDAAGWRSIFLAFVVFSGASAGWLILRQPETLPPAARRPLRARPLARAVVEVCTDRTAAISMLAQSLAFSMLFSVISTIQPVFEHAFGRAETFPLWFGGIALVSALGSLLNAALVERIGMRRIATTVLALQAVISTGAALLFATGAVAGTAAFAAYVVWVCSLFFLVGLTIGNLNALAMEPMGHIAGLAASVIGSVATVLAVVVAVPVGLAFDGTPLPVAIGIAVTASAAFALVSLLRDPGPDPGGARA